MASEKMSAILAILHELRKHCEDSGAATRALAREQDPRKRQMLGEEWMSCNTSIAALCHVLEITAIPPEEMSKVISELEALRDVHAVLNRLLEELKRS